MTVQEKGDEATERYMKTLRAIGAVPAHSEGVVRATIAAAYSEGGRDALGAVRDEMARRGGVLT